MPFLPTSTRRHPIVISPPSPPRPSRRPPTCASFASCVSLASSAPGLSPYWNDFCLLRLQLNLEIREASSNKVADGSLTREGEGCLLITPGSLLTGEILDALVQRGVAEEKVIGVW